jgi:hypothetical protein
MALTLHRCSFLWLKADVHSCWRVQSALDDQDGSWHRAESMEMATTIRDGRLFGSAGHAADDTALPVDEEQEEWT